MNANDTIAYFQAQALTWGPRILIAVLILAITLVVARAVKACSTAPRTASPP